MFVLNYVTKAPTKTVAERYGSFVSNAPGPDVVIALLKMCEHDGSFFSLFIMNEWKPHFFCLK